LRWVWGGGWKEDSVVSPALFFTGQRVRNRELRLFGNAEWRFANRWLLNAGWFVGDDEGAGTYTAPRLMFNYQPWSDHTFRVGASRAKRAPTLLEQYGDVRVNVRLPTPLPSFDLPLLQSRQSIRPERLTTHEVGYYGRWPAAGVSLDVRGYEERFAQQVGKQNGYVFTFPGVVTRSVEEFVNGNSLRVLGWEYQLQWEPLEGSRLLLNQSFSRLLRPEGLPANLYGERLPPSQLTTVAWLQKLPQNWDFSLLFYGRTGMTWRTQAASLPGTERVDVRLAKQFRWANNRAEAAVTVQAISGDQIEFTSLVPSVFERRAFATLRVEF
jgi:iron complex outermembrane receptor protein